MEEIESILNPSWTDLIRFELKQLEEEGRDLSSLDKEAILKRVYLEGRLAAEEIWLLLQDLPLRPDYHYYEPSDFDEIRRVAPRRGETIEERISENALRDKILGGFIGRCAGNMLGKPVELMSREEIKKRLKRLGLLKLRTYFPRKFFADEELAILDRSRTTLEGINCVVRDDDIDYVLLNLKVVEKHGASFSTADIGEEWLLNLPYKAVYTAERMAYRNLIEGLKPPETALYLNPFREWIGAQIRADLWGYICPGKNELAAELAYRDAKLSHVKNGIYGEIMIAAMISRSFFEENILEIIKAGLHEIPSRCRLRNAVEFVIELWKKGFSWEDAIEKILEKFSGYSPIHTINNMAIVVAALLWGEGDYGETIAKAVLSGLDTDCNGATVGSIIGVMKGYSNIKEENRRTWFRPLNNVLESIIPEFNKTKITEVVDRIVRVTLSIQAL